MKKDHGYKTMVFVGDFRYKLGKVTWGFGF